MKDWAIKYESDLNFFISKPQIKTQRKPRVTWNWENISNSNTIQKLKFITEIKWRIVLTLKSEFRSKYSQCIEYINQVIQLWFICNSLDIVQLTKLTKMTKFYSGSWACNCFEVNFLRDLKKRNCQHSTGKQNYGALQIFSELLQKRRDFLFPLQTK